MAKPEYAIIATEKGRDIKEHIKII